jgi:hypothetical protein
VTTKRIPWVERSRLIKERYPLSVEIDWYEVFSVDPAILGGLINDILKLDQSRQGKPGKRPSLEEESTAEKLRKIQDDDYTNEEFSRAFRVLCGDRSVRSVAAKTGLDKSYVHRLLNGTVAPSSEILKTVAEAFGKSPSYFLEHRIYYILGMIENKLFNSPESSIVFYNKISGRSETG